MQFASREGEHRYADLVRVAERTIIGLDFDGTLAPIVDDPDRAHIHPDAAAVLVELAPHVGAIAVITGRPARQALDLGGLEEVGDAIALAGKELHLYGQYGNEHWTSRHRRIVAPRPPRGLATFERDLPRTLRLAGASDAYVEDKGLAVAVHTRRLPDPQAAFDRLLPPLRSLAGEHGMVIEPGRNVIEVRSPGSHKGMVVEKLAADLDALGFLFAGDDLGDLEAFEAIADLGGQGLATLRVCSASQEQSALIPLADVVVKGPEGVVDLLRQLRMDIENRRT
ncbi:trehalose-phosphatase [Nocardioides humilatus]|uniref:Trehalose 6-phosphate phosphatase n=1 Tax=Nocardioides humilatus TaxID=2607660 RepID=A0A5B1LFY4_9ACTN|nr:trehalose-phosphatase [Nocardioides humilatus]KAA1419088.1 trehalose-phosphatase [Nocardioides humilatus]